MIFFKVKKQEDSDTTSERSVSMETSESEDAKEKEPKNFWLDMKRSPHKKPVTSPAKNVSLQNTQKKNNFLYKIKDYWTKSF